MLKFLSKIVDLGAPFCYNHTCAKKRRRTQNARRCMIPFFGTDVLLFQWRSLL